MQSCVETSSVSQSSFESANETSNESEPMDFDDSEPMEVDVPAPVAGNKRKHAFEKLLGNKRRIVRVTRRRKKQKAAAPSTASEADSSNEGTVIDANKCLVVHLVRLTEHEIMKATQPDPAAPTNQVCCQ